MAHLLHYVRVYPEIATLIWNKWNENWMEGEGALPPGNWKIITLWDYAMSLLPHTPKSEFPMTDNDWRDHVADNNLDVYYFKYDKVYSLMLDDVEWNPTTLIVFASTYVVVKNESG